MEEKLDYAGMTLEALLLEQKKLKNKQLLAGFVVGFLLGIIIYSAIRNGFNMVATVIPFIFIVVTTKNAQKIKIAQAEVKAAIASKNTAS